MTTMTSRQWKPSEAQVQFVKNLFAKKVANDAPNRAQFWDNIRSVSTNEGLTTVINHLKSLPDLQARPVYKASARPARLPLREDIATESGLYRDPADGTLYRLTKATSVFSTPTLSVYSNKATVRRLTPEGRMVKKGKWTRLTAPATRRLLAKSPYVTGPRVLAEWLMSDEEKLTWAVGFCMFCNRGLIDAVSVYNNIGPDCAEDRGIVRATPPEV